MYNSQPNEDESRAAGIVRSYQRFCFRAVSFSSRVKRLTLLLTTYSTVISTAVNRRQVNIS